MNAAAVPARRVLVVDDDQGFLATVSDILDIKGFDAITASSAHQGLSALETMVEPPPVALVDLMLPDMDGLELVKRLQHIARLTQVVILTGNASLESALTALRSQSFDYLVKPVQPDQLLQTIEAARERWHERMVADVVARERQRQADILEASPVGMMIVNPQGEVEYVNRPAEVTLGRSRDELVGMDIDGPVEGLHRIGDPVGHRIFQQVLRTRDVVRDVHYMVQRPDGSEITLSVSGAPLLDPDGKVQGVVESLVDVTDRLRLEEALRQSQKMEAIGRLAGSVSHDFNNVLQVIRTTTELLIGDPATPPEIREELTNVQTAARHADGITRQLLACSRREPASAPTVMDPNSVVAEMEPLIERLIPPHHHLVVELGEGVPPVRMDTSRFQQVVLNLCVNARDAMGGTGTLTIRTFPGRAIVSDAPGLAPLPADDDAWVVVEVSDTGSGMSDATRARLFEPFFTTKDPGKGTGLGLATVYGFVHQAGGNIKVESTLGEGSTFTIALPAANRDGATALKPPIREEASAPQSTKPCTVLAVAEDDQLRAVVRRALVRRGHTVVEASHGREALDVISRLGETLDVLVFDCTAGGQSAEELVLGLLDPNPDLGVLLLTREGQGELPDALLQRPRVAHIGHPFALPDLIRAFGEVRPPVAP